MSQRGQALVALLLVMAMTMTTARAVYLPSSDLRDFITTMQKYPWGETCVNNADCGPYMRCMCATQSGDHTLLVGGVCSGWDEKYQIVSFHREGRGVCGGWFVPADVATAPDGAPIPIDTVGAPCSPSTTCAPGLRCVHEGIYMPGVLGRCEV